MGLDRDLVAQLRNLLRPLSNRIANTVARAVVHLANDEKRLQLLQLGVLAGETVDDAEHHQSYGFSSVPLAGAEAVALFPNGDRGHAIVVAVSDRRYRPTEGEPGQVTMYHYNGATVTMLENGDIQLTPGTGGEIKMGSASASTPPALASELASLKSLIAAWTPVPNDGGASLKAVFAGWLVPGATKVKVE